MKFIVKSLTLYLLATTLTMAHAQVVNPGHAGTYTGKGSFNAGSLDAAKLDKFPATVILNIEEDGSCEITINQEGSSTTVPGTGFYGTTAAGLRFDVASAYLAGRVVFKGKGDKLSLTGKLHLIQNGFTGAQELDLKLKKIVR